MTKKPQHDFPRDKQAAMITLNHPLSDYSDLGKKLQMYQHLKKVVLYANNTDARDLNFLHSVPGIEELSLTYMPKLKDASAIMSLKSLRCLQIHDLMAFDLNVVAEMPWLEELRVWFNKKVVGHEAIGQCVGLRHLFMDRLQASSLAFLRRLQKLKYLKVQRGELELVPKKWTRG